MTLSCDEHQHLRQISKKMATGPSCQMGLLHKIMWGLVGTSYRRDTMNVGGSITISISSARRRVTSILWLNFLSTSLIYQLVKAVARAPSLPCATLDLVTPHLPNLNNKLHTITSMFSIPSPISFLNLLEWFWEYTLFPLRRGSKRLHLHEW